MSQHDRLVVCPQCDELIVEDEWHVHRKECRDGLLCEATEGELLNHIQRMSMREPHWYEKHDRIRKLAEEAVDRWEANNGRGPRFMAPAPQPGPTFSNQFLNSNPVAPINMIAPQPASNFTQNTTTYAIIVNLPHVPLKREEAVALAMDQLYEQWEVYTDV